MKGVHAEAMPQPLWHGGRAGDVGRRHDGLNVAPRGGAAPAPEPQRRKLRISLRDPQLEHAIKSAEHVRRQGHLPDDPALPALESLDTGNAAERLRPLLLLTDSANWVAEDTVDIDLKFLLKQNL